LHTMRGFAEPVLARVVGRADAPGWTNGTAAAEFRW